LSQNDQISRRSGCGDSHPRNPLPPARSAVVPGSAGCARPYREGE